MHSGYNLALVSAESAQELEKKIDLLRSNGGAVSGEYSKTGKYRTFAVYDSQEELLRVTAPENRRAMNICDGKEYPAGTVFLFPGSGIHQKKMLTILNDVSGFFKRRLEELDEICSQVYDVRLLDEDTEDELADQLRVLASEIAIAEHWENIGCHADSIIGHSMGEYAAAVFAGIMSERDAFFLLKERCIAMSGNDGHCMAAAEASAERIMDIANAAGLNVTISAYNAPEIVTVCGVKRDMELMSVICRNQKIRFSLINGSRGGHYQGLRDCAEVFLKKAQGITFHKPEKHFISTLDPEGTQYSPDTPEYWYAHIWQPVKFMQAVGKLVPEEVGRVIDVGVSPVLINMVMKNLGNIRTAWIPTVRAGRNYSRHILHSAGIAFNSGINIDLEREAQESAEQ